MATQDWPAWTFTIEGHLGKHADPRRLVGACSKTMNERRSDPTNLGVCFREGPGNQAPWLLASPAAVSRPGGGLLPVTTTTAWNLIYKP